MAHSLRAIEILRAEHGTDDRRLLASIAWTCWKPYGRYRTECVVCI